MNLASRLLAEKFLQPHHMRAAIWFEELPSDSPYQEQIQEQCFCIARWTPYVNVSPHTLLKDWCIGHKPFPSQPPVVGMLREALNSVDRCMRQERGRE
jgi:hypothetical protein